MYSVHLPILQSPCSKEVQGDLIQALFLHFNLIISMKRWTKATTRKGLTLQLWICLGLSTKDSVWCTQTMLVQRKISVQAADGGRKESAGYGSVLTGGLGGHLHYLKWDSRSTYWISQGRGLHICIQSKFSRWFAGTPEFENHMSRGMKNGRWVTRNDL